MQPTPKRSESPTASAPTGLDQGARTQRVSPRRIIARREVPSRKGINVKAVTFWRWERAGKLTPIRIGGRVYYDEEEVDGLMANAGPMPADPCAA